MAPTKATHHAAIEIDGGVLVAVIGGAVAVATATIAGFWAWITGRKHRETEAQTGFATVCIALLAEVRAEREVLAKERDLLITRVANLEATIAKLERHIAKLERIMRRHKIEIVEDES